MHCVDLKDDTLKMLGIHLSYNQKLKEEKNLDNCSMYSTSTENIENEKSYTRRENSHF